MLSATLRKVANYEASEEGFNLLTFASYDFKFLMEVFNFISVLLDSFIYAEGMTAGYIEE